MKKLITLFTLIAACLSARSGVNDYDFTCCSNENLVLYYKIISEEEKTCEVVTPRKAYYNVETLTIPSTACNVDGTKYSVIRVGSYSVQDCDKLTKVVFSEGVKEIGVNVFYGCPNLKYLTIPTTLETIGNGAFYKCTSLSDLSCLTNSSCLKEIGVNAFAETSVTTFYITAPLDSIGYGAFNTPTFMNYENKGQNSKFIASNGLLYSTDKNSLLGVPRGRSGQFEVDPNVKVIGANAFYNCDLLTEVRMPEGLQEIGYGAFLYCRALSEFNFPQSLKTIGTVACAYINNIAKVTFGENITSIGTRAFEQNKIEELRIPDSVESIGDCAFNNSASLKSVSIGKNLSIPNLPLIFQYCREMENITISNDNPNFCSINNVVYSKDLKTLCFVPIGKSLAEKREITVLEGTETIAERAFIETEQLAKVNLPKSLRTVERIAFMGSKIEGLNIAEGLVSIGESAFQNCEELTSIKLPSTLTELGNYVFQNCSNLSDISLPVGLKVIPEGLFSQCSNLNELVLPKGVEIVKNYAFSCAVEYLEVPASIKLFEKGAMTESKIKTMKIWHKNPSEIEIYEGAWFIKTTLNSSEVKLLVPKGTKELYEAVPAFAAFSEIEEFDPWNPDPELIWDQEIEDIPEGDLYNIDFAFDDAETDPIFEDYDPEVIEITSKEVASRGEVVNGKRWFISAKKTGTTTLTIYFPATEFYPETEHISKTISVVAASTSIDDIKAEQQCEVYSLSGVCVYQGTRSGFKTPMPGVYVIKIGAETSKLIVK